MTEPGSLCPGCHARDVDLADDHRGRRLCVRCLSHRVGYLEQALDGAPRQGSRPRDAWDEHDGAVLWWRFPVVEPPYVGTPLDDDFPEHVTHWTRISVPGGG